jgi:hypothetical protein
MVPDREPDFARTTRLTPVTGSRASGTKLKRMEEANNVHDYNAGFFGGRFIVSE